MHSDHDDELLGAITRELERVFGDLHAPTPEPRPFLMLPVQGDAEFLAFLRTVPAGTPWERLVALADAYKTSHPGPPETR
jgi:hypothetical protein